MPSCFVIMPFGGYFDGYWDDVIRPSLKRIGIEAIRGDEIYTTGAIINDIYSAILEVDFCLADVTNRNPNVNYELGMAHATNKPTILITQKLKDVPFDYRHLRHIVYDPQKSGWQSSFESTLRKTVQEIQKNPLNNLALQRHNDSPLSRENRSMLEHLLNIFQTQKYELDRENDIFIDNNYNCRIVTNWKGTAKSKMFLLRHSVICDLPCKISVSQPYDVRNAKPLNHVTYRESNDRKTYFALFEEFRESGHSYHIRTEVIADGYFDVNLMATKDGALLSSQATSSGIENIRKIDRLHFPNEERFAKATAEIVSHPNSDMVGKVIATTKDNDKYVLEITYEGDSLYNQEVACIVRG